MIMKVNKTERLNMTLDKGRKDKFLKYLKEDYMKITSFFIKKIDEYIAEKESKNDKKK